MVQKFLNTSLLHDFNAASFNSNRPFPHQSFQSFLTDDGFRELRENFPPLALFKKSTGRKPGKFNVMAYAPYIHFSPNRKCVPLKALPGPWQEFIKELHGKEYRAFLKPLVGSPRFKLYFEWQLRRKDTDVSPHVDAPFRIANHLFYFNSSEDWDPAWGGSTLLLGKRERSSAPPQFEDFGEQKEISFLGNRSLFYVNSPAAWHGVKKLDCPEGVYRRVFVVMVLLPDSHYFLQGAKAYLRSLFRPVLKKVFPI